MNLISGGIYNLKVLGPGTSEEYCIVLKQVNNKAIILKGRNIPNSMLCHTNAEIEQELIFNLDKFEPRHYSWFPIEESKFVGYLGKISDSIFEELMTIAKKRFPALNK